MPVACRDRRHGERVDCRVDAGSGAVWCVRIRVSAYDSRRQRLRRPTAEDDAALLGPPVDGDDARSFDLCLDGTNPRKRKAECTP